MSNLDLNLSRLIPRAIRIVTSEANVKKIKETMTNVKEKFCLSNLDLYNGKFGLLNTNSYMTF